MANITTVNKDWQNYFKGEEFLEIEEGQATGKYKITYNPLTMTKNDDVPDLKHAFHEGTLFFPF